jgi:pimeloyl-ACP methyl ester carboxylesterase
MMLNLVEKTYDTGEIVINFAEGEKNGKPLILLHGGTQNWQSMSDLFPILGENWHMYAPSLRGHGKSGRARSGYSFGNFGADVTAFLEGQVCEPAVLVGFSLGACTALVAAARAPKLVRALVLLEPALRYFCDSWPEKFPGIFEYFKWIDQTLVSSKSLEDVVERCKEREPDIDETANLSWAERIFHLDPQYISHGLNNQICTDYVPEQLLQEISCPALLVYGEPDLGSILNEEDIALFKEQVPHGRTFHAREVGHGVIWEPSGPAVLDQVVQFLDTL